MKIYSYKNWQLWYDRTTRCWWGANFDKDDNQIGDALDAYTKSQLIEYIEMEEN